MLAWLVIVAVTSIFVTSPKPARVHPVAVAAIGIPALFLLCGFITWFIAYYATGEPLALRARNELEVFIIAGLTISAASIARFAGQFLPSRPIHIQVAGIVLAALLCLHLLDSRTMAILKTERPTFTPSGSKAYIATLRSHSPGAMISPFRTAPFAPRSSCRRILRTIRRDCRTTASLLSTARNLSLCFLRPRPAADLARQKQWTCDWKKTAPLSGALCGKPVWDANANR